MRYLLPVLILFLFNLPLCGQGVSSAGKQFFFSFYTNGFSTGPEVRLYLASKVSTTGTITNPNTGYSIPFSIAANSSTVVPLSSVQCVNNTPFTANNLGLIVNSNDSITVFARNITFASEDVSMILPVEALSTSYMLTNLRANDRFVGVFLIQATENNTVVEINPSVNLANGFRANQPYTITLNRGQTYYGSGSFSTDISGTTIKVLESCKPIAVFTGSPAGIVPFTFATGAEHMYEQVLPDFMMGMEFVTPVLKNRNSNLVRITTAYDGTTLFVNGSPTSITFDAKSSFQFETSNTPQHIVSNFPVQVAVLGHSFQYDITRGPSNYGDPTLIMISPLCLPVKESFYSTPGNGPYPLLHGVSVICKTSDIGQMRLDGQPIGPSFQPVPGNILYSHAIIDTDSGYHYLSNPLGFQAYASSASFFTPGQNNGATSYGFNTSAIIEPIINHFSLNGYSSIDTLTAEVCLGASTFVVRAPQQDATFTWDFGDGSPKVSTAGLNINQNHTFLQTGLFEVTLTIESKCYAKEIIRKLKVLVKDEVKPLIKISASPNDVICQGTNLTFRAAVTNGGVASTYQWLLNGTPTGINTVQYGPVALSPNDWVKCVVTTSLPCASAIEAVDSFQVKVTPLFQPQVTISTPATEVCSGSSVSFTAQTPVAYQNPVYRWIVNGTVSGSNSPSFAYIPANNDRVSCVLTVADLCARPAADTSEGITIRTIAAANPTISIQVEQNDLCVGTAFRFTANTSFGGANPIYNWFVNGVSTGVSTPDFSSILNNGDKVTCSITSSLACVTVQTAMSDEVIVRVRQPSTPIVTIGTPRTDVCQQDSVFINTNVAGTSVVPTLQWFINGNLFATNNSGGILLTNLKNNDTVSAKTLGGVDCLLPSTTNSLVFKVAAPSQATVTIQSPVNGVCIGSNIAFTSVQTNAGASPGYIWRVNGQRIEAGNANLILNRPVQDVRVQLELISSAACVPPVLSNLVEVRVFSLPVIQFSRPDTVILFGTSATLRPTVQSSSPIERFVWSPAASVSNVTILSPTANPEVTTQYSLRVTDQNNCSSQANFEVIVSGQLLMPNAFTPNNDGLNDLFAIPGRIFVDLRKFTIFNRWGQMVFETQNIRKGWDGSINGKPLPSGSYIWVVEYRDAFTGVVESLKGTVMLLR